MTWKTVVVPLSVGILLSTGVACSNSPQSQISGSSSRPALPSYIAAKAGPKDVIVQLFNYPFTQITAEMPLLKSMGYAQIHVSPPNLTIDSDQWWARYQPVDYRMISGPLGNEAEFKQMIKVAHQNGIKIIVDTVLNHTANESSPLPQEAKDLVAAEGPLFQPSDYHEAVCISDYNDPWQVQNRRLCGGDGDTGLPDLDQNSPHVLQVQREFLARLVGYGVDGFRLDAVKHMDPNYFPKLLTTDLIGNRFVFGEVIADASTYEKDLNPYLSTSSMSFYDFPLRKSLQDALGYGGSMKSLEPLSMEGGHRALSWNRSVGFIMNHDIPNNGGFRSWILEPTDEELAYAFLLGRAQGVPYVYSDLGTKGGAGLIDDRWDHAHRSEIIGNMVTFHNYVWGQSEDMLYADDCVYVMKRGDQGLFGINKCDEEKSVLIGQVFADSNAYDLVSRSSVTQDDTLSVPARSYRLLVHR